MPGISVLIQTPDSLAQLQNLLRDFFQVNTQQPVELIILEACSSSQPCPATAQLLAGYASQAFIRHIPAAAPWLPDPESLLQQKARYSRQLLIRNQQLPQPRDLAQALDSLAEPGATQQRLCLGNSLPAAEPQAQSPQIPDLSLSPAAAGSTFGRQLLAILEQDCDQELAQALSASEAQLQQQSSSQPPSQPLVSVIMPTYNRARIISQAVASVLEQTYPHWELLLCDDGSTDQTREVIQGFRDSRISYRRLPRQGAAAARNTGLALAQGQYIAYLDSDNCWHPLFLQSMLQELLRHPGRSAAYADFLDYRALGEQGYVVNSWQLPEFRPEDLLQANLIDLNTFMHHRELFDCFGGFTEGLSRLQDYEFVLKCTWLRDPLHLPRILGLYQRSQGLEQITEQHARDTSCERHVQGSIQEFLTQGLPLMPQRPTTESVTILSWDACRNHLAKAYALAEALSRDYQVQLISFFFFGQQLFQPLRDREPGFETLYLPGADFPEFFASMHQALHSIQGQVVYAVKPRLPSLGLGLLAHKELGLPLILELNDLETVVSLSANHAEHQELGLQDLDPGLPGLRVPYSETWCQALHALARELPVLMTHNQELDALYGNRCLYMRNIKDESVFDPGLYDRKQIRAQLGFSPRDRVILFAGSLRRHKGVYELASLIHRLGDSRYKLLFVGSDPQNPDQQELLRQHRDQIRLLPPQDQQSMARINLAADLVILWQDPEYTASHYQMPYKATDALAMQTPIIANDISDLGLLGRQGYLRLVPFGDWPGLLQAIQVIFQDQQSTRAMVQAGRRLFQRQFSYAAARGNFALALHRIARAPQSPWPPAQRFSRFYWDFASGLG